MRPDDVAQLAGTDPDATARLIRAMSGLGVLEETAEGTYSLSSVGQLLVTDKVNYQTRLPVLLKIILYYQLLLSKGGFKHSVRELSWSTSLLNTVQDQVWKSAREILA